MKTAISIPDRVFKEAEQTARRLKMSRSELYRTALEAFLAANRDRDVKESYDAAFSAPESAAEVRFRRRAARKVLASVEWEE
jgi:metal-responsive CopG/Arc/MetJ family transcriptional regulator